MSKQGFHSSPSLIEVVTVRHCRITGFSKALLLEGSCHQQSHMENNLAACPSSWELIKIQNTNLLQHLKLFLKKVSDFRAFCFSAFPIREVQSITSMPRYESFSICNPPGPKQSRSDHLPSKQRRKVQQEIRAGERDRSSDFCSFPKNIRQNQGESIAYNVSFVLKRAFVCIWVCIYVCTG